MFSLLTQAPSTAPPSQPSHSSPPSLNTDTPFPQGQQRPHVTPEEIRQFFLDYHHRKKKEESLGISEEQEAVDDMGQDNKEGRGREGGSINYITLCQLVLLHRLYPEAEAPPTPSSCSGRVAALCSLPLLPFPLPPPHGAGHSRALHHSTKDRQGVHQGEGTRTRCAPGRGS